jgi:hypothetical protein
MELTGGRTMSAVRGIYRDGKIELRTPSPEWADGTEVGGTLEPVTTTEIGITGDSPEASAAWLKWFDEFQTLPRDEGAADELEQILRDIKQARREGACAEMLAWTRLSAERRAAT